jgi:Ca2+-binding EF-hand superfamily protein
MPIAVGCRAKDIGLLLPLVAHGCATSKLPLAAASPLERQFAAAAVTWDLNHDGDVTCEEWKQYASALFREADSNHDGVLTPDEYGALGHRDKLFEMAGFAYFDADGDGRITLAELIDKPNPAFTLLDTNPLRSGGEAMSIHLVSTSAGRKPYLQAKS